MSSVILLAALRLMLRLDIGTEYDSNANRAEVIEGGSASDTPAESALTRLMVRGGLSYRRGISLLRVSATIGGKVFFSPKVLDQNMLVGQIAIDERLRLHRLAAFGVGVDYYDAEQLRVSGLCTRAYCGAYRDFRTGSALARLYITPRAVDLSFGAGYRGFQYKPESGYDFHAAQADALLVTRHSFGARRDHELDVSFNYHYEWRHYDARRTRASTAAGCAPWSPAVSPCLPELASDSRIDHFHQLGVDLTYVGAVLVAFGYAGQLNDSSSYQQTFWRHMLSVKLGFQLPWRLALTLKGQLMATVFRDPILLDQRVINQTFITAEDENRNAFIADLERPIKKSGWSVYLRYSLYTNQLSASPAAFIRHLGTVGFSYRLDGAR